MMSTYHQGYKVYLKKCEHFGLEPVNFRYYMIQLSQNQLDAFNAQATKEGKN